jgi:OmpA family.
MLIGSADSETSNPQHNQWLSEQRCLTVKNYLVEECNLPADQLVIKPLGGTDTFIPARLNRAVFICSEGDRNALKEVEAITK